MYVFGEDSQVCNTDVYEIITDQEECFNAAKEITRLKSGDWKTENTLDYVSGCSFDHINKEIYFNSNIKHEGSTSGVPICKRRTPGIFSSINRSIRFSFTELLYLKPLLSASR